MSYVRYLYLVYRDSMKIPADSPRVFHLINHVGLWMHRLGLIMTLFFVFLMLYEALQ